MSENDDFAGHFGAMIGTEGDDLEEVEVEALPLEEVLKMVEVEDEDVQLMVDTQPEKTTRLRENEPRKNKADEETAQRMAGQTHAKFKQVRAEKPNLKMKYMGGVRRY